VLQKIAVHGDGNLGNRVSFEPKTSQKISVVLFITPNIAKSLAVLLQTKSRLHILLQPSRNMIFLIKPVKRNALLNMCRCGRNVPSLVALKQALTFDTSITPAEGAVTRHSSVVNSLLMNNHGDLRCPHAA
jgi:hypothetical protein